ncbi:MAG: GNAT family N-acyltransferase [Planctomycetota bacterium]
MTSDRSPSVQTLPGNPGNQTPLAHQERIPTWQVQRGRYSMYFARTVEQREQALRLRYEVFHLELGEGDPSAHLTGLDRDEFDEQFQHLLVMDTTTGDAVGTYRMQTAASARDGIGYYTQQEFDLERLGEAFLEDAVELGRACVAAQHRNKVVLYLLWQGLVGYLGFHGKRSFFGCSSLTSQDMAEGLRLYRALEEDGHVHPTLRTVAQPGWVCEAETLDGPPVKVPKLFGSYLRQGARVLAPPAIDRGFGTIDYLTYMLVTDAVARRYALPGR